MVPVSCAVVIAVAVFLAIFGPLLAPHDPNATDLTHIWAGPQPGHPLGFDEQGRDLLSRLLTGARTSMAGPFLIVALAMLLGSVLALAAAWFGGLVDGVISSAIDVAFAFPAILLAVLSSAVFGAGVIAPAAALAIAYTPFVCRVLRGAMLQERAREYIAACEVQGLSAVRICTRHLLPNVLGLFVAQATLLFGYAVMDFAAISFIGLGVRPPTADWGVMVSGGESGVLQGYPTESLIAGLCIVAVVVAVTVLGESFSAKDDK